MNIVVHNWILLLKKLSNFDAFKNFLISWLKLEFVTFGEHNGEIFT